MKRLKDFIYNWNDIIVILCILAAAAAIIYWRSNIIMDYPHTLAMEMKENAEEASEPAVEVPFDESTEGEPEPGAGPRNGELWGGGMLKKEVTLTTTEGSAADAVEVLVKAGLFTSYEDFEAVCHYNNLDPTDIKANTFTFPLGSTQSDIVKEVTKPMS